VLMGTMTATPCYLYVLQTMPVSVSSTFAYVTPVLTLIFGYMFLGEPISQTMIVGASIILAGVILVQYINYRLVAQRQILAARAEVTLEGLPASQVALPAPEVLPAPEELPAPELQKGVSVR